MELNLRNLLYECCWKTDNIASYYMCYSNMNEEHLMVPSVTECLSRFFLGGRQLA